MEPLSGEDLMGMTAVVVSRLGFEDTEIARTERRIPTLFDGLPDEEALKEAFMGAIWNDIVPYHKLSEAPGFGLNGAYGTPDVTTTAAEKVAASVQPQSACLNLPRVSRLEPYAPTKPSTLGHPPG